MTGLNALTNGVNVDSMFPYFCKGELMIDGRHFGDWVPQGHGRLNNIDDALAVSCNVFFADVGLRLGRDRLLRFLNSAGFDGQANLGIFAVPLGKTRFWALMAVTTSCAERFCRSRALRSRSTETTRCLPPYG